MSPAPVPGGSLMKIAGLRLATAGAAAAVLVTMTACSSGLGGSSSGGGGGGAVSGGSNAISLFIDNTAATINAAKTVVAAFEKANPGVTVKTEIHPGGTEGDNLVKTKLSTGSMDDVFWY